MCLLNVVKIKKIPNDIFYIVDYHDKFVKKNISKFLIVLKIYNNIKIKKNFLPKLLKTLYIDLSKNINKKYYPLFLKNIFFESFENNKMEKNMFPLFLKKIKFNNLNKTIKKGILPKFLKYLILYDFFYNYNIKENVLPNSLIFLAFRPITCISNNLLYLDDNEYKLVEEIQEQEYRGFKYVYKEELKNIKNYSNISNKKITYRPFNDI